MGSVFRFIKSLFLIDLLKGLWITLKYTPKPAFTFQYPAERRPTLLAQPTHVNGNVVYCFDLVLQGVGETVFFNL